MDTSLSDLMPDLVALAKRAGAAIMPFFAQESALDITQKPDKTPLTAADLAANQIIVDGLKKLTPQWPILSEEDAIPDFSIRSQWTRYWLLDPLDGTRGFVNRSDEFTVNIALIDRHQPIIGVIYAPAKEQCYVAFSGGGAFREGPDGVLVPCHTKPFDLSALRVVIGKYHGLKRFSLVEQALPSFQLLRLNSSLKFCLIAEGSADIYPRFGPISEWDTAAGQCILTEAGGMVVDLYGEPLQYNAEASILNPEFVAIGDRSQKNQLLEILGKYSA